jgi:putative ABC transport system substrate-binding protein
MMDRRKFIVMAAASAATASLPAKAQTAGKVHRIGYLGSGSSTSGFHEQFRQGLRELGWIEGQNIVIDYRFADGRFDRLPELAADLVRLKVDIIVAQPTPAALAARNATGSIPIVMINVGDPVGLGLVAGLARPAGNVTGTAFDVGLETFGKALELLKEAIPKANQVAVLSNPANPAQALAISHLKPAAQSLRLKLLLIKVRGPDEFDRAFAELAKERVRTPRRGRVVVSPSPNNAGGPRAEVPATDDVWPKGGCGGRGPHVVRA